MSLQTRAISFVYVIWDSDSDRIVGLLDEQGHATYFPYWNSSFTELRDPTGNPSGGTATGSLDRSLHVGQDSVRIVNITANYTLLSADLRDPTIILANSSSPITVFYPANSTVSVRAGVPIDIVQWGTGAVTLVGASGVNVVGAGAPTTRGQYAILRATKILANTVLFSQEILASGGPLLVTPPVVTGSGVQGSTLTLTPGTYSPDGTHTRQWRRVNLSTGAITNVGAGATTYASVAGDVGSGIDCVETVTDSAGLSTQGVSNQITIVAAAAKPVNTVAPFIVGGSSSSVGGTVTINAGTWSNSPTGYKFQRRLDGTNDGAVTNQAGATLAYTIQSTDAGKNISWSIVAYNGSGDADAAAVSPNWPIVSTAPVFTAFPVITYSSAAFGADLTCSNGTVSPSGAQITKRWGFTDPAGPYTGYIEPPQTGDTYTTNASDIGSQIWCEVSATNVSEVVTFRTLGPTITGVAAPPPPAPNTTAGLTNSSILTSQTTLITATSGQTIQNLDFTGTRAYDIVIPFGVSGVTVRNCRFTGTTNAAILNQGSGTLIENCHIFNCTRGIYSNYSGEVTIRYNNIHDISGGDPFESSMINTANTNGPVTIVGNYIHGDVNSDAISNFAMSRLTMTDNIIDINQTYATGAAFTIGDTTPGLDPGRDMYIARNTITQTGFTASAAGVFGSSGNTIIEYNRFRSGIQIMLYPPENPAPFVGVIVRKNVINFAMSNLSAVGLVSGWETNVDGIDIPMPA